jgi:biotin carboxylase
MKRPSALFLAPKEPLDWVGLRSLHCLSEVADRIHVVSDPDDGLVKHSRHADAFVRKPFLSEPESPDQLAHWVDDYCRKNRLDFIIPSDVPTFRTLANIKDHLSVPTPYPVADRKTLDRFDNKWAFYVLCREHGVDAPETTLIAFEEQITETHLSQFGFPVVVKPVAELGGRGVVIAKSLAEIQEHLRQRSRYTSLPLILQEYVAGEPGGFNLLAMDGEIIAWTIQMDRADCLDFIAHEPVLAQVRNLCQATRFTGVAHLDFIVDPQTGAFKMIEANPRFWISVMLSMWRGLNFLEAGMYAATGQKPAAVTCPPGPVYKNKDFLRRQLWRSFASPKLLRQQLRASFKSLSDPMPFLYKASLDRSSAAARHLGNPSASLT